MSGIGHNSKTDLDGYVERMVNLLEQKAEIGEDIKELKKEAKGNDVDPADVAAIAALKHKGEAEAKAKLAKLERYVSTLGWAG